MLLKRSQRTKIWIRNPTTDPECPNFTPLDLRSLPYCCDYKRIQFISIKLSKFLEIWRTIHYYTQIVIILYIEFHGCHRKSILPINER